MKTDSKQQNNNAVYDDDFHHRSGGNTPLNLDLSNAQVREQLRQEIDAFDKLNQINVLQKTKYHIPLRILIFAALPPSDAEGVTTESIHSLISDLEYEPDIYSVRKMVYKFASPRPNKHRGHLVEATLRQVKGIKFTAGKPRKFNLGITTKELYELIDKGEFTTYSFNLDATNPSVTLVGKQVQI